MIKKIVALLFILTFTIVIAACTGNTTTLAPTTVAPTTEAPTTVAPTTVAPTTGAPTTQPVTTEQTTTEEQPTMNIIETAEAAGSFTTLLAALNETGLTSALEAEGEFTVFAPTDEAFNELLMALDIDAATLLGVENLSDILLYHVLSGAYYSGDVVANAPFTMATLEGSEVEFTVMDGKAYINGVEIITTDILTTNGVIHVIDGVVLPLGNIIETATDEGTFTTLLAALDSEGLTSTLAGPGVYTVFAPTDDAFNDLMTALSIDINQLLALENLDQILLFHVLSGDYYSTDVLAAAPISIASLQGTNLDFTVMEGQIYVNGIEVETEDILTTNGIIHVITAVLLYE